MDHASIQSLVFGKRGNAIGVSAADLVSELRTGNSLADWASLAPGAEMAIEIKSPYDNVKRLGSQLRDYRSMFPSVTVVVHEKNLRAVSGLTDADRAGLVVVRGTGSRARVELERSPSMHYGDIRLRHLLAVLRMRELAAVVERLSAQTVDASQVSAFLDAERLLEPFDLELVCSEVFNLVRRRRRLPYALAKAKVPIGIRPVLIGIDPPPGTLDYLVDWLAEGV
ncbi:sce7726 family protein [Demequina iriomotensis]|uniref:sce7726 family protein n=1 Tax=Demequina iriomotensis TaxID=1536641 RepID=UPI0007837E56|nr:sce7726 family protein [Demequina iriomotensis]